MLGGYSNIDGSSGLFGDYDLDVSYGPAFVFTSTEFNAFNGSLDEYKNAHSYTAFALGGGGYLHDFESGSEGYSVGLGFGGQLFTRIPFIGKFFGPFVNKGVEVGAPLGD